MPQYLEQMSGCSGMPQTFYAPGLQIPELKISEYALHTYAYGALIRALYMEPSCTEGSYISKDEQ